MWLVDSKEETTMAYGDPLYGESREQIEQLIPEVVAKCKWVYDPASYGRTGINAMWNHNARWLLKGALGLTIAVVPIPVGPVSCFMAKGKDAA